MNFFKSIAAIAAVAATTFAAGPAKASTFDYADFHAHMLNQFQTTSKSQIYQACGQGKESNAVGLSWYNHFGRNTDPQMKAYYSAMFNVMSTVCPSVW